MINTAVIGHPIKHSKSPLIHSYWLEKYGISGAYTAIDIAPDNLQKNVQRLVDDGYAGFNVTVPHKISIIDLCENITPLAQKIGAVNTITINDGKLYGDNTDAYGFAQNIKESFTDWSFEGKKSLVIGAGGAANAIMYALLQEGVDQITITNRTREKAAALMQLSPDRISVVDWEKRSESCEKINLIINTSALGMVGKPPLDIDISKAAKDALVTDIVYAPLETDLLKQAKSLGLKTVTGIGMLLHQARPGFEKWNGILPEVTKELEKLSLR